MVEVKMSYYYTKDGKSYKANFQCTEMDDAIELLQKINEVFYDEGYRTSDANVEEAARYEM